MSMNRSSPMENINEINQATTLIVICLAAVNIPAGLVGQVLNLVVFTRPKIRKHTCSLYFLASSYSNLFIVLIIMPIRVISGGFQIDPANVHVIICKMEYFIFNATRSLSMWLITLACLDRYLSTIISEIQRNRFNSSKITKRIILCTTLIMYFLYSHTLFYYNIGVNNDLSNPNAYICKVSNTNYRLFFALFHALLYSVFPCIFMFIFGTLALINISRHRQKVRAILPINRYLLRRSDRELIRMLTVQVFVIIVTTIVFPIYQTYASITVNITKSILRLAYERLANQIVAGVGNIPHMCSFYLYTLTGTVFRQELKKSLIQLIHWPFQKRTYTISFMTKKIQPFDRNLPPIT